MAALAPRRQRPRSAVARRRRSDVRRRRRGRRSVPDGGRGAVGARALRRRLLGRPPAPHPRPDLVGHRAARRPAGRRGRGAPAQGTRRAHDEHRLTAAGRRAARRRDRRPCRRARGRAGRPLPRRTRRPRAPDRTRARRASVRRKLARDGRRLHALDLPAVRPAGMRAPRGPLPGGTRRRRAAVAAARRRTSARRSVLAAASRAAKQHHRGERRIGEFVAEARSAARASRHEHMPSLGGWHAHAHARKQPAGAPTVAASLPR